MCVCCMSVWSCVGAYEVECWVNEFVSSCCVLVSTHTRWLTAIILQRARVKCDVIDCARPHRVAVYRLCLFGIAWLIILSTSNWKLLGCRRFRWKCRCWACADNVTFLPDDNTIARFQVDSELFVSFNFIHVSKYIHCKHVQLKLENTNRKENQKANCNDRVLLPTLTILYVIFTSISSIQIRTPTLTLTYTYRTPTHDLKRFCATTRLSSVRWLGIWGIRIEFIMLYVVRRRSCPCDRRSSPDEHLHCTSSDSVRTDWYILACLSPDDQLSLSDANTFMFLVYCAMYIRVCSCGFSHVCEVRLCVSPNSTLCVSANSPEATTTNTS